jgi:hypothetical protein
MPGSLDMAKHRPQWQRVKIHRNYTVDEAARTLNVAKGTVRRWLKDGLPCLKDQKPALILGRDLKAFGASRARAKQKCQLHECYCFKCQKPRAPALNMAEYAPLSATRGNLRAFCSVCETIMHKGIAKSALAALGAVSEVSICRAYETLPDIPKPSPNDDLGQESKR